MPLGRFQQLHTVIEGLDQMQAMSERARKIRTLRFRHLSLKQSRQAVRQLTAGIVARIGPADFQTEPHEPSQCLKRVGIIRFARHPSLDRRAELIRQ